MQSVLAWRCYYLWGLAPPLRGFLRQSSVFVPIPNPREFWSAFRADFFRSGECGRVILRVFTIRYPLRRMTPNARCYRRGGRRNAIASSSAVLVRRFFQRSYAASTVPSKKSTADLVVFGPRNEQCLSTSSARPEGFCAGPRQWGDLCTADLPLRQSARSKFSGPVLPTIMRISPPVRQAPRGWISRHW